ncbi:MAG TPA: hypothetical protein VK061_03215 [Bacillota bacterium]|nr:hypothetical protein [Bacillota bacterium]
MKDKNQALETNTQKKYEFSEEAIKKLLKGKKPIKIRDGVMQIDKDHPDYELWLED